MSRAKPFRQKRVKFGLKKATGQKTPKRVANVVPLPNIDGSQDFKGCPCPVPGDSGDLSRAAASPSPGPVRKAAVAAMESGTSIAWRLRGLHGKDKASRQFPAPRNFRTPLERPSEPVSLAKDSSSTSAVQGDASTESRNRSQRGLSESSTVVTNPLTCGTSEVSHVQRVRNRSILLSSNEHSDGPLTLEAQVGPIPRHRRNVAPLDLPKDVKQQYAIKTPVPPSAPPPHSKQRRPKPPSAVSTRAPRDSSRRPTFSAESPTQAPSVESPEVGHMTRRDSIEKARESLLERRGVSEGSLPVRAVELVLSSSPPSRRSMSESSSPSKSCPMSPGKLSRQTSMRSPGTLDPRAEMKAVFRRVQDDGSVHRDDLGNVLESLGHQNLKQDWITEVCHKVTKYVTLNLEEFYTFVDLYKQRAEDAHSAEFARFDTDNSGHICTSELADCLRCFGIEPMRHVLLEVIEEIDEDQSGLIDVEEFHQAMNILNLQEGFCLSEYDRFMVAFEKFDADGSGELDATEMYRILSYLGYSFPAATVQGIIRDVDTDKSGEINKHEFLNCMRKLRESDVQNLKEVIALHDDDDNNLTSVKELMSILNHMGYFPLRRSVDDAALEVGIPPPFEGAENPDESASEEEDEDAELARTREEPKRNDAELDLSDMFQLLEVYRRREGLSKADIDCAQDVFVRFVGSEDDGMKAVDVGLALRWMGYIFPYHVQQILTRQVDVDGSGDLDIFEFRKMVRVCREHEIKSFQECFSQCDAVGLGLISEDTANEAWTSMGCLDASGKRPGIHRKTKEKMIRKHEPSIDLHKFLALAIHTKQEDRYFASFNEGFSRKEVLQLEMEYAEHDIDGSGKNVRSNMYPIIERMLPEVMLRPRLRPLFIELISQKTADKFDFKEFLKILQEVRAIYSRSCFEEESEAVEKAGFTADEVHEYRQIFVRHDYDGNSKITLDEFKDLISVVCPMGEKTSAELTTIFYEVCKPGIALRGEYLGFPEFLLLMKRVAEINLGGIQDRRITR